MIHRIRKTGVIALYGFMVLSSPGQARAQDGLPETKEDCLGDLNLKQVQFDKVKLANQSASAADTDGKAVALEDEFRKSIETLKANKAFEDDLNKISARGRGGLTQDLGDEADFERLNSRVRELVQSPQASYEVDYKEPTILVARPKERSAVAPLLKEISAGQTFSKGIGKKLKDWFNESKVRSASDLIARFDAQDLNSTIDEFDVVQEVRGMLLHPGRENQPLNYVYNLKLKLKSKKDKEPKTVFLFSEPVDTHHFTQTLLISSACIDRLYGAEAAQASDNMKNIKSRENLYKHLKQRDATISR